MAGSDDAKTWELVKAQRLKLCDGLEDLRDPEWETPSYCQGWLVRDVLGHLVSIVEVPSRKFYAITPKGANAKFDHYAREFGKRSPKSLIESYRKNADFQGAPPFLGPKAPLTDAMVHSLDMTEPLERAPLILDEAVPVVLDALANGMPFFSQRGKVRKVRFEATDRDWSHGSGPLVKGTSVALMLAMTGRADPHQHVEGAEHLK